MEVSALIVANMEWMKTQATWFCSSDDDAAEVMSKTILRCLESAGRFDSERAFRPWAKAIMRNISADHFRRNRYMPLCPHMLTCERFTANTTESDIMHSELQRTLAMLADRSPQGKCLRLYLDGYTYREIAEMQKISIGTVKSRLSTARANLRQFL